MKYIKWGSTILAFLAIIGIVILSILPLKDIQGGEWGKLHLGGSSLLLLVVIVSASFAIYPKSRYDYWLQRFLAGIALLTIPALSTYYTIRFFRLLFVLINTSIWSVPIFFCFFIKKKTKLLTSRTKKILEVMCSYPLFASVVSLLLCFSWWAKIEFAQRLTGIGVILLPLSALMVGIPAIMNGKQITKVKIYIALIGVILAELFLYGFYTLILNYVFVGE